MKATVYPGSDGWRWNVQGSNNEILASGEAYVRRTDAENVLKMLFGGGQSVEVSIRGHNDEAVDHYVLRPHTMGEVHSREMDEELDTVTTADIDD